MAECPTVERSQSRGHGGRPLKRAARATGGSRRLLLNFCNSSYQYQLVRTVQLASTRVCVASWHWGRHRVGRNNRLEFFQQSRSAGAWLVSGEGEMRCNRVRKPASPSSTSLETEDDHHQSNPPAPQANRVPIAPRETTTAGTVGRGQRFESRQTATFETTNVRHALHGRQAL